VLFMTTIGTSRSSVAYLIEVLVTIARELDVELADMSLTERAVHERAVQRLTAPSAPLPDFSGFHPSFTDCRGLPGAGQRHAVRAAARVAGDRRIRRSRCKRDARETESLVTAFRLDLTAAGTNDLVQMSRALLVWSRQHSARICKRGSVSAL